MNRFHNFAAAAVIAFALVLGVVRFLARHGMPHTALTVIAVLLFAVIAWISLRLLEHAHQPNPAPKNHR